MNISEFIATKDAERAAEKAAERIKKYRAIRLLISIFENKNNVWEDVIFVNSKKMYLTLSLAAAADFDEAMESLQKDIIIIYNLDGSIQFYKNTTGSMTICIEATDIKENPDKVFEEIINGLNERAEEYSD